MRPTIASPCSACKQRREVPRRSALRYRACMKLVLLQPALAYDAQADNLGIIARLLEPVAPALAPTDIVLLPEHVELQTSRAVYERGVSALAKQLGCHVVGGSHHEERAGGRVNAGVVSDGSGQIIASYEKLRPYADERSRVAQGSRLGEVSIGGRQLLVLICADFWFSDLFSRTSLLPDVVLVPAYSVSRKPTPDYSRALWRHLAVARAYEFGVYVGVSDWAHTPKPHGLSPSAVGGFADPTRTDPAAMFAPITDGYRVCELDFEALQAFREDRHARGFFWRAPSNGN
jgi:predicted amidohydrolase